MRNLSVFIVRIKQLSDEDDLILEVFLRDYMKNNFYESDCNERMIFDEESNILIAFIAGAYKYKLDGLVELAKKVHPDSIGQYEDITDKFLYDNDYSDYDVKSDKINNFLLSNLNTDDVLDKINSLGIGNLTEIDHQILTKVA